MKFSKLSTIPFYETDFQRKSEADLPIIPRGEPFTIVELSEGFSRPFGVPSMPPTMEIINERTGKKTTISNITTAPCTFVGAIPKTARPGNYRAEIVIGGKVTAISALFRIVADNKWGCIIGNNPLAPYSDGTQSVIGGKLIKFYHYFMRKDLSLAPIANNTFYDDEQGTSFSLQNKNYIKIHLEGYSGERTAAAISLLLAGSWSILRYFDGDGNETLYRLYKSGETAIEAIGRGFVQFSGDFNGRRQNAINISWEDALEYGIDFNGTDNTIVRVDGEARDRRIPTAVFCLPFTNVEIEQKNGSSFNFNLDSHFTRICFTTSIIPDNFGRALVRLNVDAIRQGDKVTEIGDNVLLANMSTPIEADFPSLNTVGRNVKIGVFTGTLQFSDNSVFDNLKLYGKPSVFCKGATFKNCKLKDYTIVGDVARLINVELDPVSFKVVADDAVLEKCKLKYDVAGYTFTAQKFVNCRMFGSYNAGCTLDLMNFSGTLQNSFIYQRLKVKTSAGSSTFKIDEASLHGYVEDYGNYLYSIQRKDGRTIDNAGAAAVAFTIVNGAVVFDYEPKTDTILTNDGAMLSRGNIKALSIGARTPARLLSDVTMNGLSFSLYGDLDGDNLNNVANTGAAVNIAATYLLQLLQSGGSYLNNIDFSLSVDNDLPAGFSYLLFKNNSNVLQNTALTINVTNDTDNKLRDRLRELYPNFTIN